MRIFNWIIPALLLLSVTGRAQNYTFENDAGIYTPLVNGILHTPIQDWDNSFKDTVDIGFPFYVYDTSFTKMIVNERKLYFAPSPVTSTWSHIEPFYLYQRTLIDRANGGESRSRVFSDMSGSPGNRIMKIEYRNMGIKNASAMDSVHFQVWLYEGSNNVEIHYGPSFISSDTIYGTFPGIGIFLYTINPSYEYLDLNFLKNASVNPSIYYLESELGTLTGYPAEGRIYRFKRIPAGIEETFQDEDIKVYPTVFNDKVTLEMPPQAYSSRLLLVDAGGKLIINRELNGPDHQLDMNEVPAGLYLMQVYTNGKMHHLKLIKQ